MYICYILYLDTRLFIATYSVTVIIILFAKSVLKDIWGKVKNVKIISYISTLYYILFLLQIRSIISDFAVFITILTMVLVDYALGVPSPKLQVPNKFKVRHSPDIYIYVYHLGVWKWL